MIPLRDTIRSRHFPIMTWLIIGANVLVFLFELLLGQAGLARLINTFALVPARLSSDTAWFGVTLISSLFLHSGWFHILSNMWILGIFGDNVEDRMGPVGFLLFYLSSGLVAGLLQTFVAPGSTIPVLGASGAIAGILGAYILMFPASRIITLFLIVFFPITVQIPAVFFLGFWFISQIFSGVASLGVVAGGVAWWAHIGGFIFGLVLSRFFLWRPLPPPRPQIYYPPIQPRGDDPYFW